MEERRGHDEVQKLHDAEYHGVELSHMYADNCAMQLVRNPKQFDVIVTDNLFGDLLSDCAAMLTGSLGMLPSASLGAADSSGRRKALYEPVHGSAPSIAGRNRANPVGAIASAAMMLRHSFRMEREALAIETAIEKVLKRGVRTSDLPGKKRPTTTSHMGDLIAIETKKLLKSSKFRNL